MTIIDCRWYTIFDNLIITFHIDNCNFHRRHGNQRMFSLLKTARCWTWPHCVEFLSCQYYETGVTYHHTGISGHELLSTGTDYLYVRSINTYDMSLMMHRRLESLMYMDIASYRVTTNLSSTDCLSSTTVTKS